MENFKSQTITGVWREGYCLDFHIIRSECTGYNQAGHPQFRTERTEIGELLYRLKYCSDRSAVTELAAAAEQLLKAWKPRVDVIVPVPPSRQRALPPVLVLAEAIGKRIGIPLADCLKRKGEIPALKDVSDHDQRLKLLDGLHEVDKSVTRGKRILLFDDLYRSGATMNAITADLYQKGMAKDVFAMTITRTRSIE